MIEEGDTVTVFDGTASVDGEVVLRGAELGVEALERRFDEQRARVDEALAEFAENTVAHVRMESDLLTDRIEFPPTRTSFRDRQVLIVVRGDRHRHDLKALRAYIRDVRPVIVAVDGAADGVLEEGLKPDIILGDMDSAGDRGPSLRGRGDRPRLSRRAGPGAGAPARDGDRRTRSSPPPGPARTWRC